VWGVGRVVGTEKVDQSSEHILNKVRVKVRVTVTVRLRVRVRVRISDRGWSTQRQ
jgi:hypothetical protein